MSCNNFLVEDDFISPVIVRGNFKDGSMGGFSCRVFPGLAHLAARFPASRASTSAMANFNSYVWSLSAFDDNAVTCLIALRSLPNRY
jgi:hypothetical protein